MVNVGKGDFVLRATRAGEGAPWTVEQDVPYSKGGAKVVPTASKLVWGGDGHNHWHVQRVAINRLVPLDSKGRPVANGQEWPDAKVGFCFYDFSQWLYTGPLEQRLLARVVRQARRRRGRHGPLRRVGRHVP